MTDNADAILKGMLKIGISDSRNDDNKDLPASNNRKKSTVATTTTNVNASAAAAATASTGVFDAAKKEKVQNNNTPSGKTSRGKPRAGSRGKKMSGQAKITDGEAADGGGDGGGAPLGEKTDSTKKKKKKNSKSYGGGVEGDSKVAAATPSSSEKQQHKITKNSSTTSSDPAQAAATATNYAWSAFQSSPDPSALPDIGGLFGNNDNVKGTGGKLRKSENKGRKIHRDDAHGGDVAAGSLNLGRPPSADIRASLVQSMIAKDEKHGANKGEGLLQRLTTGHERGGEGGSSEIRRWIIIAIARGINKGQTVHFVPWRVWRRNYCHRTRTERRRSNRRKMSLQGG